MKYTKHFFLLILLFLSLATISTGCKKKITEDTVEKCRDGIDNDEDGFTDCEDLDCADLLECNCDDGVDNDGDGFTDCNDFDCHQGQECDCSDGVDNDGDGFTDCDDVDCDGNPAC